MTVAAFAQLAVLWLLLRRTLKSKQAGQPAEDAPDPSIIAHGASRRARQSIQYPTVNQCFEKGKDISGS